MSNTYRDLLDYSRRILRYHKRLTCRGDFLPDELNHTGLEDSCSGTAWNLIYDLNKYIFTTGSTNTFESDESWKEPMWLSCWVPKRIAFGIVSLIAERKYAVSYIIQDLDTAKVLLNSIDPNVHRFWSVSGLRMLEDPQLPVLLRQCSERFSERWSPLFTGDDPLVGMWLEADDETSRDMYTNLLSILQSLECCA